MAVAATAGDGDSDSGSDMDRESRGGIGLGVSECPAHNLVAPLPALDSGSGVSEFPTEGKKGPPGSLP